MCLKQAEATWLIAFAAGKEEIEVAFEKTPGDFTNDELLEELESRGYIIERESKKQLSTAVDLEKWKEAVGEKT